MKRPVKTVTTMGRAAFRAHILALIDRKQEREIINRVFARIQPGKHFIGLWIYRQKKHRKVRPLWTATLWDKDGDYVETPLRTTPAAAMRDVERMIWSDPSGREGRGKEPRT